MSLKKFLIFLSILATASSQTISCNYYFATRYRCDATINNPQGLDGNVEITGTHVSGRGDTDVAEIWITFESLTTIIPSAICEKFQFVHVFSVIGVRTITSLTEGAFQDCGQLREVFIWNNPIINVHPLMFKSNVNIFRVSLRHFHATALPAALFLTLSSLSSVEIANSTNLNDLQADIFQKNHQLTSLQLNNNNFNIWRPEWTQRLTQLNVLLLHSNLNIASIPRNAVNAANLREINIGHNQFNEVDFFHFNDVRNVLIFSIAMTPVRAIDFNLIDRMTNLDWLSAANCDCINRDLENFQQNRPAFMAELEPCFEAFDDRILSFTTSSSTPLFNSIRREQIQLQVQTFSDAILTFSANPDGSSPNFEISLGIEGNTRSCIHENGIQQVCRATNGILNPSQMETFIISWFDGIVNVEFRGQLIMFAVLDAPFAVRFMGVRTSGHTASWIIQQQQRV